MAMTTMCQVASLLSFSKSSVLDGSLRSTATVKEKTCKCFTSALCNAGVAVTLICVTVFGVESGSDIRTRRQDVDCIVLRETGEG